MNMSQNWSQSPNSSKQIDVSLSSISTEDDLITKNHKINIVFTDLSTTENGKIPQSFQVSMNHREAGDLAQRLFSKVDDVPIDDNVGMGAEDLETTREAEGVYDSNTLEA